MLGTPIRLGREGEITHSVHDALGGGGGGGGGGLS